MQSGKCIEGREKIAETHEKRNKKTQGKNHHQNVQFHLHLITMLVEIKEIEWPVSK